MRVIGLVILLVGLVLVATVTYALYGAALMVLGAVMLIVTVHLQKRLRAKAAGPGYRPVRPTAAPTPSRRRAAARPVRPVTAPAPAKKVGVVKRPAAARAAANKAAPRKSVVQQRDHEPALDKRFEPIFEGEESTTLFQDLRSEISAAARDSLTVMRNDGFVIRARADRVSVSRNNHTEVLRSNAAIVDYLKQLGLSE